MYYHDNVVGNLSLFFWLSILFFMGYILHTSSLHEETVLGFIFPRSIIHLYYLIQELNDVL